MVTPSFLAVVLTIGLGSLGQVKLGEPAPDPAAARAAAVARAKSLLAETLKLGAKEAKEISVVSAKETTWPDASLGCPEKGRMYAQMVMSGWTVVLKAKGRTHEVHVAGNRGVACPGKGPSGGQHPDR